MSIWSLTFTFILEYDVALSELPRPSLSSSNDAKPSSFHPYPFYSPRFWNGMGLGTWLKLLASSRGRIHPTRLPMALAVTCCTPFNDLLRWLQYIVYRRRLQQTELEQAPLFIVGHWRSGTTLLHELMTLDHRLSSPSTFQCFAPHHFLVSEWVFTKFGRWLLPAKRPMDNMTAGWDRPQEDEFALMNLGLPSPYRRLAFPNNPAPDLNYLDWQDITSAQEQRWVDGMRNFLTAVTYRTERPLVLKSPTHTGRIAMLARSFPNAKFIHITRDPRSLFPSTCRLWNSLEAVQAFQKTSPDSVVPYVVESLRRMYDGFHAGLSQLAEGQIVHIRYEDLVADPFSSIQRIYDHLDLGEFSPIAESLQNWVTTQHGQYQTNQHSLSSEQEAMILDAWSDYFQRYGYA